MCLSLQLINNWFKIGKNHPLKLKHEKLKEYLRLRVGFCKHF